MTDQKNTSENGIDRRTVLKGAATAGAIGFIGVPAFSGSAVASSHTETLYLTDSGGDNGFVETGTKLYSVDLDDDENKAMLNLKLDLTSSSFTDTTSSNFDQVDAIAATPDGSTVYLVDKNSEHLGSYSVEGGSFSDKGRIADLPQDEVVLATYSPGGTFYVAGQSQDALYTIDPNDPSATKVTDINGVNVNGADIAFDSSGTLYLYSSADGKLYTISIDDGTAALVGDSQTSKGSFTGLAVRDDGAGDLVGSSTSDDTIYVLNKQGGGFGEPKSGYQMYIGGSKHNYGYGDMTVGQLCEPCDSGTDLLVKYEWDDDDEEFYIEDKDDDEETADDADSNISLESVKLAEGEPVEACFSTDYCDVEAIVKAGNKYETYGDEEEEDRAFVTSDDNICVTGIQDTKPNGKTVTYAISNIRFYCDVPDDTSVGESGEEEEEEEEK